ncbi:MAG: Ribosomal protein S12 methylthiotransferase RimO [Verrucomicrobiae bacterium]|nr:Ribosomal protein S12 methylthiotransferase RimO [Verrucomicrobiae bacterium]
MPAPSPIKIGLVSLGCAKNLVDSEVMLGALAKEGMELTADAQLADVVIVNTCGFIEASKQESINAILKANELRTTGKCKALIMAGCLTQRYPKELRAELPEVDAIVGLNEVPKMAGIVREILAKEVVERASRPLDHETNNGRDARSTNLYWSGPAKYVPDFSAPRVRLTPQHTAYVKIAEGCNHPCTFCSIPRIRGLHRSRSVADVLQEMRQLVAAGCRELNLISQDTTFYGKDLNGGQEQLCELLRQAQQIPGDFWIRLLYTHPAHWSDELIATIAGNDKVCRYVDMPLQHINDAMLKRMKRETSGQYIRELIARIRRGVPGIALRTTFIVGFPGETDEQFDELCEFIERTEFERLGIFTYSQEDHTPAGNMDQQLPEKVKKARHKRAMLTQQQVSRAVQRRCVGQTLRVLVEKPGVARSHADAPEIDGTVKVTGTAPVGEFATVRITGASEYDLEATVL